MTPDLALDAFDIEKLTRAVTQRGFDRWELYREVSIQRHYTYRLYEFRDRGKAAQDNRVEKTHLESKNGFSFWAIRQGQHVKFVSQTPDAGRFFEWLGVDGGAPPVSSRRPPLLLPPDRWKSLQHQGRSLAAYQAKGLKNCAFQYSETVRRFEVTNSFGETQIGHEEQAHSRGTWAVEVNGQKKFVESEHGHSSLSEFEKRLKGESLYRNLLEGSVGASVAWPAPRGNFPVYWSKEAMSTLLVQFLKGFEGDLFLDHLSYLIGPESELPLAFSLYDEPNFESMKCDLEGVSVRPLSIFSEGKPRTLATNRLIAEEMEVQSSGHARRQDLNHPSTIGFWRPTVLPSVVKEDLLGTLSSGIRVEKVNILRFDPATANALIQTHLSRLIHHGELGEWIEPLTFEVNLLELFKKVESFDDQKSSNGVFSEKKDQRFLTEVITGGCVTPDVSFPGNVPGSHYW